MNIKKHKPTNVERTALERQAGRKTFDPAEIGTTDLPIHNHMDWSLVHEILFFAML